MLLFLKKEGGFGLQAQGFQFRKSSILQLGAILILLSISAWVSIFLVFGFALLHFLLTLGAPIGEYALGGAHRVLPVKMRFVSGSFLCLWILVGLSYLQLTEKISPIFNTIFVNVLLVIYTLFLAYAIVGNWFLAKSKKEKYVMTPLSIVGFICSAFLLFNFFFKSI